MRQRDRESEIRRQAQKKVIKSKVHRQADIWACMATTALQKLNLIPMDKCSMKINREIRKQSVGDRKQKARG